MEVSVRIAIVMPFSRVREGEYFITGVEDGSAHTLCMKTKLIGIGDEGCLITRPVNAEVLCPTSHAEDPDHFTFFRDDIEVGRVKTEDAKKFMDGLENPG